MSLRGYYSTFGDDEDNAYLHYAIHDLRMAKRIAARLDEPGRRRMGDFGWACTNPVTFETGPFELMEEQLACVLYATGHELRPDIHWGEGGDWSDLKDIFQGAHDAAGRHVSQDPMATDGKQFLEYMLVCLTGDGWRTRRLARHLRAFGLSGRFRPRPGLAEPPAVYHRPPAAVRDEDGPPTEPAAFPPNTPHYMTDKHTLMFFVPGELGFWGEALETYVLDLLLDAWEYDRGRAAARALEANRAGGCTAGRKRLLRRSPGQPPAGSAALHRPVPGRRGAAQGALDRRARSGPAEGTLLRRPALHPGRLIRGGGASQGPRGAAPAAAAARGGDANRLD